MSTHDHDQADPTGHDADAGGHDDHFDPEPATALSPGESASPAWLPILGAGLFLVGGTYFLATPGAPDAMAAPSASVSASAAPRAIAPPSMAPAPTPPRPAIPNAPRPNDPDIMNKVRQQMEKGAPGAPSGQPVAPGQPQVIQLQPPANKPRP